MIRATTNGVLRSYKSGLMRSFTTLNKARDTVLSGRNFNSYADDPGAAAQSFQLRRSFMRISSQYDVGSAVVRKYESAYSTLESVINMVDNGTSDGNSSWATVLRGISDTSGDGREALGQELTQLADSIVQTMNGCKYGDNYVFSGADGLNVPFEWRGEGAARQLYYRGVPVDALDGSEDLDKLNYMSGETKYEDLGLGLQEDADGKLIASSAFDTALKGINYLGYGVDGDGDPKNIASIVNRMGALLGGCKDGAWADPERDPEEFKRLADKLEAASGELQKGHVKLTAEASFLKSNQEQLVSAAGTLNEQIAEVDKCDLADALTAFAWAQYSYNAALKMGNSILSQSLMDYLS